MFRKTPDTETISALEVAVRDVILDSPVGAPPRRWWGFGPRPRVIRTNYLEDGEGRQPTVYIETAEAPGWTYCMDPEDRVTIHAR